MKRFLSELIIIVLLAFSCRPSAEPIYYNEYRAENRFPLSDNLKGSGAYLVLEWNGQKPWIMASGNLVDKKKGLIRTAKHFTDSFGLLGLDYCKVFLMNGKVYRATLEKVPPVRDAALIKLSQPFSVDDLPEPLPTASVRPKFGDRVFVQGFHPHPYHIRQTNQEEDFPDKVISIFTDYYGQMIEDKSKESQVVFDNLEGKRVKPDQKSIMQNPWLSQEQKISLLQYEDDRYIKVLLVRDHKFSFGGLSGGAALNEQGEVFGIITAQNPLKFEVGEHGFFFIPGFDYIIGEIKKQFWDTIYITPLDTIDDLQK